MTSECKCVPENAILNEFFWHRVFLPCVFDVHCPQWVTVQAIVLLPTGLSCSQLGHLLIPKQARDLKMLYLKAFLHRHFREGTGWAEQGCDCMCLLGLRLCCLLQAGVAGVDGEPWSGIWALRPVWAERYWVQNMSSLFKTINCCIFIFQNCVLSRI